MTVLRAEVTDLPEVVTQAECRALFEIEAFLPNFGLVHDLEFDMRFEIIHAHLFGETLEHSFAGAIHERVPILFTSSVEMSNRD